MWKFGVDYVRKDYILPLIKKKSLFRLLMRYTLIMGFPGGSVVKNLPANAGETGDRFEFGRPP